MSRAKILSNLGKGQYQIEVLPDIAAMDAQILSLSAIITTLTTTEIPAATAAEAAAKTTLDAAIAAQNVAIAQYSIGAITLAQLLAANTPVLSAAGVYAARQRDTAKVQGDLASAQSREDYLTSHKEDYHTVKNAWCADLSENLTSLSIATCEVAGGIGEGTETIIFPANDTAGVAHDPAIHGTLRAAASLTKEQLFYNLAMRDAWSKWDPTYRLARITSLDTANHTCSIDYFAVGGIDTAQNLNQSVSATGVPIEYMGCHSFAFAVGDEVLVRFESSGQDWGSPKVIGFRRNPRGCGIRLRVVSAAGVVMEPGMLGLIPGESFAATTFIFKFEPVNVGGPFAEVSFNMASANCSLVSGNRFDCITKEFVIPAIPNMSSGASILEEYRVSITKNNPVLPLSYHVLGTEYYTGFPYPQCPAQGDAPAPVKRNRSYDIFVNFFKGEFSLAVPSGGTFQLIDAVYTSLKFIRYYEIFIDAGLKCQGDFVRLTSSEWVMSYENPAPGCGINPQEKHGREFANVLFPPAGYTAVVYQLDGVYNNSAFTIGHVATTFLNDISGFYCGAIPAFP